MFLAITNTDLQKCYRVDMFATCLNTFKLHTLPHPLQNADLQTADTLNDHLGEFQ
jgi:hypothetical protein